MRRFSMVVLLAAVGSVSAQEFSATRIIEKFHKSRPPEKALAFYQLDWEKDLTAAKVRAKREGRPVLLVWVTNITAACNFYSGHC